MPTLTTTRRAAIALLAAGTTAIAATGIAAAGGGPGTSGDNAGGNNAGPTGVAKGHTSYYVAVGDSLTAGLQPTTGDDKTGGFAGRVAAALTTQQPGLQLANFGCSGETTTTMTAGGICAYDEGNQLDAATAFMRAHRGQVKAITVTIGANDVLSCVAATGIDQGCLADRLAGIQANLPSILAGLRKAAPNAELIVLNYYNPMLANYLRGPAGQQLAAASTQLLAGGNTIIEKAALAAHGQVADVAAAFASTDTSPRTAAGVGTVPTNVAQICALTWMCTPYTNIHPNDAGYQVMADTVLDTIGKLGAKGKPAKVVRRAA